MHEKESRERYPLHWAVWDNDVETLNAHLDRNDQIDIDTVDPRGRTPLMLAVTLDRDQCASVLLERGANADAQNKDMWSVSHEAISTGNPSLLRQVIKYRDFQRSTRAAADMKLHLEKLQEAPDFYAEMSWEFASWVPLVSKLCPSDTYKIWKKGSSVRIDTTLVGFEGHSWQRGKQSFIFRLLDGSIPQLVLIDHQAYTANIQSLTSDETLDDFDPPEEAVYFRMTSPVSTTFIDMDRIGFERSKGNGFLSWIGSGERKERVSGHDCKIFNASNVDLVTKTRSEHLSDSDRTRFKQDESSNPLSSLLNMVRSEYPAEEGASGGPSTASDTLGQPENPLAYFDGDVKLARDIGKPRQVTRKSNSFKATLYLAEQYPLSLQDQVAPIVNLMSSSSAHFARLNAFMRLQLPAGFPVKIEIPLFHVVSAKITFGRINEPGEYVTPIPASVSAPSINDLGSLDGVPLLPSTLSYDSQVEIDSRVFDIPEDYHTIDDRSSSMLWWPDEGGNGGGGVSGGGGQPASRHGHPSAQQQEDMLLQLAIEQSLLANEGTESPTEGRQTATVPPRNASVVSFADEERMLALAIERSLQDVQGTSASTSASEWDTVPPVLAPSPVDMSSQELRRSSNHRSREEEMMELAMKLSIEEAKEDEKRREEARKRRERGEVDEEEGDDEELKRVLALSMQEM